MRRDAQILIVGAGPVGLTAAIELARRGFQPRIVSANDGPVHESRGLGVNQRTLCILRACGATDSLLREGLRIRGLHFSTADHELFHISISGEASATPPIIIVPQSRIEEILVEILSEHGIEVEWRKNLEALSGPDNPKATIRGPEGMETIVADLMIAADGAHSVARHQLDIDFPGSAYEAEWGLADVRISTALALDEVHGFDLAPVLFVMIPIRENLVRFFSDQRAVLKHVPKAFAVESVEWESGFRISHRQARTYQKGRVFLAGDAAHIHSPIGARGMNLGIEDAAWLAWSIAEGRTDSYTKERWPVGRQVLNTVDPATRLMASDLSIVKFMRRHILPSVMNFPPLRRSVVGRMTGGDTPEPPWLKST